MMLSDYIAVALTALLILLAVVFTPLWTFRRRPRRPARQGTDVINRPPDTTDHYARIDARRP